MKKAYWLLVPLFLLAGLQISETYALYRNAVSVVNRIQIGDIQLGIREYEIQNGKETVFKGTETQTVMPAQVISRIPKITNYANPCYVRVKITSEGKDEEPERFYLSEQNLMGMEKKWKKAGEYYYWTDILEKNETIDVFRAVSIPKDWTEEGAGKGFELRIRAEAIQASGFLPDFSAEEPWGTQRIEACIHEKGNHILETEQTYQRLSVVYEGAARYLVAFPENFFRNMGQFMPGDMLSDTVAIRNTTKTKAEFFFRSEIPEALTDEQRELLKMVRLKIEQQGNILYQGSLAPEDTERAVSLGTYRSGEEGSIHFTVSIPAELDNAYALRNTSVRWIFSVEGEELQTENLDTEQLSAPKTGITDYKRPLLAVLLLLGIGSTLWTDMKDKKSRKES